MRSATGWSFGLVCLACTADFDDRPYLLQPARLVAVITEPPEARPRDAVALTPVVAGPGAERLEPSFQFCSEPLAPADPRPVAERCVGAPGVVLGRNGKSAMGEIPADACARFGPDPDNGELRPADPDATGGFYQPLIVTGLADPAVVRIRIQCPLPDVSADLAREFAEQYASNQNPELLALEVVTLGAATSELRLLADRPNQLRVTWSETSVESYAWIPTDGTAIEQRTESLRVSWFTTSGRLASSATGPGSPSDSTNTLTPDPDSNQVDLWVVLQDSRGGSDAQRWRLQIAPP